MVGEDLERRVGLRSRYLRERRQCLGHSLLLWTGSANRMSVSPHAKGILKDSPSITSSSHLSQQPSSTAHIQNIHSLQPPPPASLTPFSSELPSPCILCFQLHSLSSILPLSIFSLTNSILGPFIRCNKANSPFSSHH